MNVAINEQLGIPLGLGFVMKQSPGEKNRGKEEIYGFFLATIEIMFNCEWMSSGNFVETNRYYPSPLDNPSWVDQV